MKPIFIKLLLTIVGIIVGIAVVAYFFILRNPSRSILNNKNPNSEIKTKIKATRPMIGENSFGLSVCDEVSKETVSSIIAQPIVEIKDNSNSQTTSCTYILDKQTMENIVISVAFMDANSQKQFYESQGNKIKQISEIPIDNFSVWDSTGNQIGGIYLLMAPNKFVRIERSSQKIITNEQSIALAKRVAEIILTGK